jgi:hypothetical protein
MYNLYYTQTMKTSTYDIYEDTLYDPISYFGKENTRRTKRAREKKTKKVIQVISSKSETVSSTASTSTSPYMLRSNGSGRGHNHNQKEYLRSLKRDLEMEPKVYYG